MADEPATKWSPYNGLGEYYPTGVNYITDSNGNFLVDPSGNSIVDTGLTLFPQPDTIWVDSEGE